MKKALRFLAVGIGIALGSAVAINKSGDLSAAAEDIGNDKDYIVILKDKNRSTKNAFLAALTRKMGSSYQVKGEYSNAIGGFEIAFNSAYRSWVSSLDQVESVSLNIAYSLPEDDSTDADADFSSSSLDSFSRLTTHNDNWQYTPNKGAGITVGIIDTGLFSNQIASAADSSGSAAFRPLSGTALTDAQFKSRSDVADRINANKSGTFKGSNFTYQNSKVVFEYDYGDGDNNVSPSTSGLEHGTHVASLAAANGYTYQGMAPGSQLAIFKVATDSSGSIYTNSIVSAFDDAYVLNLDTINMSIGSALDQDDDLDEDPVSVVIDKMKAKGTMVNIAAGNDGRAQYNKSSGFYADKVTTETVETSEMGSYALMKGDNVIASSYLEKGFYDRIHLVKDGQDEYVPFTDQNNSTISGVSSDKDYAFEDVFTFADGDTESDAVGYVYVPNTGTENDYDGIDVSGKIAIVKRGSNTFVEKVTNAVNHGAIAVAIINNVSESINMALRVNTGDAQLSVPVVLIPMDEGDEYFGDTPTTAQESESQSGTMTIVKNHEEDNSLSNHLSYFSSDGPTTDLSFNPDIAAPGDQVLGAVSNGYEYMSGTSMATPNFTGATAALMGEHRDPTVSNEEDTGLIEYKKEYMARVMSTASALVDDGTAQSDDDPNYASPRRAGAGMVDIQDAASSPVWLQGVDSDGTGTGKAKIEYKLDSDFSAGKITPKFLASNDTDSPVTYTAKIYIAVPEVKLGISNTDYGSLTTAGKANMANGLVTTMMESTDDYCIGYIDDGTVTVNANATDQLVTLDTIDATTDSRLTDSTTGKNILENYVDEYYPYGTYLEGYVVLEPTAEDSSTATELSIPYMGFFGDYGDAPATEAFDFERDADQTSNADIQSSIIQNVSGGKPYANYSSRIYGVSSSMSAYSAVSAVSSVVQGNTTLDLNEQTVTTNSGSYQVPTTDKVVLLGANQDGSHFSDGLVAGAPGVSDQLVITQFVQRTLEWAKVTLLDESGNTVNSTYFAMAPSASGIGQSQMLYKSFMTETLLSYGYGVYYGIASLPLQDSQGFSLSDGDYTLQFDYELFAKDANGDNYHQTKTVPLTINTASYPVVMKVGIATDTDGINYLFVGKDTAYVYVAGQYVAVQSNRYTGIRYVELPTEENPDGTVASDELDDNSYNDHYIVNGYIHATLFSETGVRTSAIIDYKGNGYNSIIGDVDDVDYFYFESSFNTTDKTIDISVKAMNAKGAEDRSYVNGLHGFTVYVGADTIQDVTALIDDEYVSLIAYGASYEYDSTTGTLAVTNLPAGVTDIQIEY